MEQDNSGALTAGRELATTIDTNIRDGTVDSAEDASAKKIFSYRAVLAVLLKLCVNEYADCPLDEIVSCIGAVKEGSVGVSPGMGGESVRQENSESVMGSEKRTYFDIYFQATLPKNSRAALPGTQARPNTGERQAYRLKIDLEIQKSLNLSYPIENRAVYYLAREVSGQLGYVYEDTAEYADLSKVFTIWLCLNDIPKKMRNTVVKHKLMVSEAYGISMDSAPAADLMEMVIIRLGGHLDETNAPDVVKYLYGIFENAKYGSYFDQYVTVSDIEKEPGIRKELSNMSGVATLNYRDGVHEGRQEGRKEGRMEGRREGRMEGRREGRILSLYFDAEWPAEAIAEKLGLSVSDVENVIAGEE